MTAKVKILLNNNYYFLVNPIIISIRLYTYIYHLYSFALELYKP